MEDIWFSFRLFSPILSQNMSVYTSKISIAMHESFPFDSNFELLIQLRRYVPFCTSVGRLFQVNMR